ncbi:unnamed protein product, partial [Larinioides sclopetarius]
DVPDVDLGNIKKSPREGVEERSRGTPLEVQPQKSSHLCSRHQELDGTARKELNVAERKKKDNAGMAFRCVLQPIYP